MWLKSSSILISFVVIAISGSFCLAACPSADLTGDCFVDFEDFGVMAAQWLTSDPCVPNDMAIIPRGEFAMGDSIGDGWYNEWPVHLVTVDLFYMGKYETSNQQYCDYLNSALAQGLITVIDGVVYQAGSGVNYLFCDTSTSSSYSQIVYSEGSFSVRSKADRSMGNDPMATVTWWGAVAYCNWRSQQEGYEQCYNLSTWDCDFSKKGYRLPTEAEWECAARGGLSGRRFPWGDTISHDQANYYSWWEEGAPVYPYDVSPTEGYHPTWDDGVVPYMSPVGSFAGNGYGLYDMAGNVREWCNDWHADFYYASSPADNPTGPTTGTGRVLRGGSWDNIAQYCRVSHRYATSPSQRHLDIGFRLVLQLPDDLALIPGGTFEMGDNLGDGWSGDELPVHTVTLDSFYMSKYETTNQQYCDYLNSAMSEGLIAVTSGVVYQSGSGASYPYCDTHSASIYSQIDCNDVSGIFSVRTKSGRDMSNDPMVEVSWYGAVAYCNWRSQEGGYETCYDPCDPNWPCDLSKKGYRLATEAECEYAARGGLSGRRFPWGDTISHSQANYRSSSGYSYDISPTEGYHPTWNDGVYPYTSAVGSFAPNGYGLYDMAGNVWEWCNDWYLGSYYSSSLTNNPTGPAGGSSRVIRGGVWTYNAYYCRVAYRDDITPTSRYSHVGFRLVVSD